MGCWVSFPGGSKTGSPYSGLTETVTCWIRMYVSHPTTLLLVFAVVSIPGGAVEFPLLYLELSDCIKDQCSEMIDDCQQRHGEALTEQLRVSTGTVKNPFLSIEKYRHLIERTLEEFVDIYFHCFRHNDLQNRTQFLGCITENVLSKAEPYINMVSLFFGTDPGLVMCWLKNTLKRALNCYNDVDEDYFTLLEENSRKKQALNQQEYITCSVNKFKDKKCFQMFSEIYGSTPEMMAQSKDRPRLHDQCTSVSNRRMLTHGKGKTQHDFFFLTLSTKVYSLCFFFIFNIVVQLTLVQSL
ncbi:uncharacterized protein [Hoplias malabaricus]|uniref:uncharacterized protein n=1 Tax=Hoplias malabaricus TaxID=27720 RepID=UPI0034628F31